MSLEKQKLEISGNAGEKHLGRSIFSGIKIGLAVILLFLFVVALTFTILYLTNEKANTVINSKISAYKRGGELKKAGASQGLGDSRISELANYYLKMDKKDAANKLIEIRAKDKKAYEKIASSMNMINSGKTKDIDVLIKKMKSKDDIIKQEYDLMQQEMAAKSAVDSTHYTSLGVRGAIDAISLKLQQTMDYESVATALMESEPAFAARVIYYLNPMYHDGITNRFTPEFADEVAKQSQVYSEFLRKNISLAQVYGKSEKTIAAAKLQDKKSFTDEDLAVIFSNMDYLDAARILSSFEDEKKVQDVLTAIKDVEDYQVDFDGSLSRIIASSIKILKNYSDDVDILKKAYEKMDSENLAAVIDQLVTQKPAYKEYVIDSTRKFTISEKEMAVEALRRMRPNQVAGVLSQLKNDNKVDKAAYLSRQIGIPEPNNAGGN